MSELLTRKQVAQIFTVRPLTIRDWEKRGIISPTLYASGIRPRYSLEEVERASAKKGGTIIKSNTQESNEVTL